MLSDSIERVELAIDAIREGRMVIMVDDEDRENEGDLCMAAEAVTPEAINFMAKEGRGLICLTLTPDRIDQLKLPMMVTDNRSRFGTAFTVSVEAARGVSTGISAADRATTVLAAVADDARPEDLVRPGHIFPLRATPGGVLVRAGQTEGSVDLARLAGMKPFAVICEIMNDDGTMSRMPQLEAFAAAHQTPIVTIADLIEYRMQREPLVRRVAEGPLEVDVLGQVTAVVYETPVLPERHLALIKGDISGDPPPLVRAQAECTLGDVFGSPSSAAGADLRNAMRLIAAEGRGLLVYLRLGDCERSERLVAELTGKPMAEANGARTRPGATPTLRRFGIGAQILVDQGISRMRLLSNRQRRIAGLSGYHLDVTEVVPLRQT